jgi:hypothetical protein
MGVCLSCLFDGEAGCDAPAHEQMALLPPLYTAPLDESAFVLLVAVCVKHAVKPYFADTMDAHLKASGMVQTNLCIGSHDALAEFVLYKTNQGETVLASDILKYLIRA